MIDICVDEAYAFDYYSILEIKFQKGAISNLILNQIQHKICSQLGKDLFEQILKSKEYKNLYEANLNTFIAVDKAKTNELTAKEVDETNFKRMIAKQKLQKKYFNNSLKEVKVGYNG